MFASFSLFCPQCHAYRGLCEGACPSCGRETPDCLSAPRPGQPIWTAQIGGPGRGQPQVREGLVLFAWGQRLVGGGVTAVERENGSVAWQALCEHSLEGLSIAGVCAYFASTGFLGKGARLYSCRLDDGNLLWSQELSGGAWSAPLVEENRLHVGCDDGQVHCLDARNGLELANWPVRLAKGRLWLARCAGQVLAISEKGTAMALDPLRGSRRSSEPWSLGVAVTSAPVVAGDWLYFGARAGGDGLVLALNGRTGQVRRFADGLKAVVAAPLVAGERLLVSAHDHHLHAYDLSSGVELWRGDCEHALSSPAAVGEGLALVAATHGELFAFEIESGELAWRDASGVAPLVSSPALAEGVVYLALENGQASAYPWHLGRYAWAAGRLARRDDPQSRDLAADFAAIAGDLETSDDERRSSLHEQAVAGWRKAGRPDKAAFFRESQLGIEPEQIAAEFENAGRSLARLGASHNDDAAFLLNRAADWYHEAGESEMARKLGSEASRALRAPYISIRPLNIPEKCEAGEELVATLELKNQGSQAAQDVRVRLAGSSLKYRLWIDQIPPLAPSATMEVETPVLPAASGNLVVEVQYNDARQRPWTNSKAFPLEVAPYQGNILEIGGDVAALRLQNWQGRIKINGSAGLVRIHGEQVQGSPAATELTPFAWPDPPPGFVTDTVELVRSQEVQNDEITLQPGFWAFFLADGRLITQVGPGRQTRRNFPDLQPALLPGSRKPAWTAVIFRQPEVRLAFRLGPYPAQDNQEVGIDLGLFIQPDPDKAFDFWQKVGQPRSTLTAGDLVEWLTPEVSGILKTWLVERKTTQLRFGERERLALELEEQLRENMARNGLRMVGKLWALEFHWSPVGASSSQPETSRYCTRCGAALPAGDAKCARCGHVEGLD